MPFLTELKVTAWQRSKWKLLDKLEYGSNDGVLYTVQPGFITDLASIPKIFRLIFEVNGKHRKAAVLHDWLYSDDKIGRKRSDDIFLEAMESSGVSYFKRYAMYIGVRCAGWVHKR